MKPIRQLATLTIGIWITQAATADITIVNPSGGYLGSNRAQVTTAHNGSEQVTYNTTGVDKLVVSIGTESGFNNQQVTNIGVSFNGVAMTRAATSRSSPPSFPRPRPTSPPTRPPPTASSCPAARSI